MDSRQKDLPTAAIGVTSAITMAACSTGSRVGPENDSASPAESAIEKRIGQAVMQQFVDRYDKPGARGWRFEVRPPERVSARMKMIAAVDISITTIQGKMNLKQGKTAQGRVGVIRALR